MLHNNEHRNLHALLNTNIMIKGRRMNWVGYVNCKAEGSFEWKPERREIIWKTYSWKIT